VFETDSWSGSMFVVASDFESAVVCTRKRWSHLPKRSLEFLWQGFHPLSLMKSFAGAVKHHSACILLSCDHPVFYRCVQLKQLYQGSLLRGCFSLCCSKVFNKCYWIGSIIYLPLYSTWDDAHLQMLLRDHGS